MKPYPCIKKLTLISLLSMGLASTPLIVNADDSNRGWRGHTQQHHGKYHHLTDHRKHYRDYGHVKNHGYLKSNRTGYKHGYKSSQHNYKSQRHQDHNVDTQRHYRGRSQYDYPGGILGLFTDNRNALYCD